MTASETQITFPARFYSRPEARHVEESASLSTTQAVLLVRNASDMGYPGTLPREGNTPYSRILACFEHIPRMRRIIDENIAPLVAAARTAGIQIMYVVNGWKCVEKYPQRKRLTERLPAGRTSRPCRTRLYQEAEPPSCLRGLQSPNTTWRKQHQAEVFFPGYQEALRRLMEVIDFAPPLTPQPEDWIVTSRDEAGFLLNETGRWSILHAGFDTHDDIFYFDAGTFDFCRSFRSFLLRDCTTGVERHDTAMDCRLSESAVTVMEQAVRCYSALGRDIQTALESPGT